jgi:DNA-binding NarL/FixJ family response regulator
MLTRPRVLLADDHPDVAKLLERMLSLECDVVGVVADGSEVAAAAARLQPVVTVMDLNLPKVSGVEVCGRILQTNPGARVIVISAMDDAAIKTEALAAGASDFVPKHMAGRELIDAIRRAWADYSRSAQSTS